MTIVEDPHTRDCVFLQQTNQGGGCAIYDVRPAQCRSWPFWEWNLDSPDAWNSTARKCPGINRGCLYTPEEIQDKTKNKKWPALRPARRSASEVGSPLGTKEGGKSKLKIVVRVSEIYKWIDEQILASNALAGHCSACGKCCDFESYDHRLYVTTPEIIYFVEKLGLSNIKQMMNGRCPYQVEGPEMVSLSNHKCTVYPYRFSGCRIFCCKSDTTFQSELTEAVIKKFKALCAELQIPYRYLELPVALKKVSVNPCQQLYGGL